MPHTRTVQDTSTQQDNPMSFRKSRQSSLRERTGSMESLATSGTFWEVGNYKVVLKRINNGPKLCDEFVRLCHERANIEKQYAKSLQSFADKWEEKLNTKLHEFGTLRDGWFAVLGEARTLSTMHDKIHEELDDPVKAQVGQWRKEHFPKSIIHFKAYKRASSAFEKAQHPFAKRKGKIDKYRGSIEKLQMQLQETRQHPSMEEDKKQALLHKIDREIMQTREKLRVRVEELQSFTPIYQRDMQVEFDRCQREERERITFFQEILIRYHQATDVAMRAHAAHEQLLSDYQRIDPDADLAKFSQQYGIDMPMLVADKEGHWHLDDGTQYPLSTDPTHVSGGANGHTATSAAHSDVTPGAAAPVQSTYAPGTRVTTVYPYESARPDEVDFEEHQTIIVLNPEQHLESGWIYGQVEATGATGIFPGITQPMSRTHSNTTPQAHSLALSL
eukprot:m.267002 g.267002  ORF g.267002 m.267002 type:complete len:446 (-) comp15634_c5_seq4:2719-4056(-)